MKSLISGTASEARKRHETSADIHVRITTDGNGLVQFFELAMLSCGRAFCGLRNPLLNKFNQDTYVGDTERLREVYVVVFFK